MALIRLEDSLLTPPLSAQHQTQHQTQHQCTNYEQDLGGLWPIGLVEPMNEIVSRSRVKSRTRSQMNNRVAVSCVRSAVIPMSTCVLATSLGDPYPYPYQYKLVVSFVEVGNNVLSDRLDMGPYFHGNKKNCFR